MKYAFSIASSVELDKYQAFLVRNSDRIEEYIHYLRNGFQVECLPKLIVLSNYEMATEIHSSIVVPAYTNEIRMVFTPDVDVWKSIYLKQIEDYVRTPQIEGIRAYYTNHLSENHLLQIIGHELTHHSELFVDDFDGDRDEGIWFEEGMVEYISSRYFLTPSEFEQSREIEQQLVALFEEKHGTNSIEAFGQITYDGSYAAIFYNYWRSKLIIERLVEELGSVGNVFTKYCNWFANGEGLTLAQWFGIE